MEGMLEAARVFGNLTRHKPVRDFLSKQKGVFCDVSIPQLTPEVPLRGEKGGMFLCPTPVRSAVATLQFYSSLGSCMLSSGTSVMELFMS